MYTNIMDEFKWGKIDQNPDVYIDENISRMTLNLVSNFVRLAAQLLVEGDNVKAVAVLDKCLSYFTNR
jgi:hypothetical protein